MLVNTIVVQREVLFLAYFLCNETILELKLSTML
jgi:hypothetical protein